MFYFWAPSSKCNRLVRGETDPGAVVHKYSLHRLDSGLEWKLEGKETLARGAGAQLQVGWFWPAANRLGWPGSNSEIMTVFSLPCLALPCPAWVPAWVQQQAGRWALNPPRILFLSACLPGSRMARPSLREVGVKTPSRSGLQVGMGPLQRFTGDNCLVWRPLQAF